MIGSGLLAKFSIGAVGDFLKSVPSGVWVALAAALLIWWIDSRAYDRGFEAATVQFEEAARKAVGRARRADGAARAKSDETRNNVEADNERARESADGSDDPLKSVFDSLR